MENNELLYEHCKYLFVLSNQNICGCMLDCKKYNIDLTKCQKDCPYMELTTVKSTTTSTSLFEKEN